MMSDVFSLMSVTLALLAALRAERFVLFWSGAWIASSSPLAPSWMMFPLDTRIRLTFVVLSERKPSSQMVLPSVTLALSTALALNVNRSVVGSQSNA